MTDARGKKQQTGRSGRRRVTRLELATALDCGLTTIDKLIARGLTASSTRGRAKTYSVSAARKLAMKLAPRPPVADSVLLSDYVSQAADLDDRRHALAELWIADHDWQPAWARCVATLARQTAGWPKRLATWAGALTPQTAMYASRAERPSVAPSTPHESLLSRMGPAEWRAQQPQVPPAVLRPLLQGLSDGIATDRAFRALADVLSMPARPAGRPAPQDVDDARQQWREARADYRRQRVAVRRDHRRRAEIAALVPAAIRAHTMLWWQGWPSAAKQAAGDPVSALATAQHLRAEALGVFTATLGGASVPAHTSRSVSVRRAPTSAIPPKRGRGLERVRGRA